MKILIVEDEQTLAEALADVLEGEAYAVDIAHTGTRAAELVDLNEYDLVVLDLTIPPPSGLELLTRWRAAGHQVPVLVLTALDSLPDRIKGLDSGADDYLPKPFSFDELLARVRSLLRRTARPLVADLGAGDLSMDRAAREVKVGEQMIPLSPKEFSLLEYLLIHKDRVVTRSEISEHVWDSSFDSISNIVNVFIYRLRRKIDGTRNAKLLHTIPGQGYVLRSERC